MRCRVSVQKLYQKADQSGSIVIVKAWRQDPSSIKQVVVVVQVHAGKDLLTLLQRNSEAPLLAVDRLVNPLSITVLARRGAHVGKVALEG